MQLDRVRILKAADTMVALANIVRKAFGASPPASDAKETSLDEAGAHESLAVLIVDDDHGWVYECALMLEQLGYRAFSAYSAEEALGVAQQHDLSIAIVDYSLPGSDGVSLIEQLQLRSVNQERQLRFIMATAFASKELAILAMRASVVDFLEKPITPDDLRGALQRVSGLEHSAPARSALLSKLSNLSGELQRLSSLIDQPVDEATGRSATGGIQDVGGDSVKEIGDFIRAELQTEARRRELAGGSLFGDPSWYMLLDLLLAKLEGRTVAVSSACIASGAPTTTALRLIKRLVNENVLSKIPDENDGRRNFLQMNLEIEQLLLDYIRRRLRARS